MLAMSRRALSGRALVRARSCSRRQRSGRVLTLGITRTGKPGANTESACKPGKYGPQLTDQAGGTPAGDSAPAPRGPPGMSSTLLAVGAPPLIADGRAIGEERVHG